MINRLPFQILILLLAGLLLGVANNLISPGGIPWVQTYMDLTKITDADSVWIPYSWEPSTDTVFKLMNTEKAYMAYLQGQALFVDARIPEDYQQGHIAGAINIDIEGDDDIFYPQYEGLKDLADYHAPIITYCSGTECDASLMLARFLYDEGFTDISIYFGGWDFWIKNDLPTESNLDQ